MPDLPWDPTHLVVFRGIVGAAQVIAVEVAYQDGEYHVELGDLSVGVSPNAINLRVGSGESRRAAWEGQDHC